MKNVKNFSDLKTGINRGHPPMSLQFVLIIKVNSCDSLFSLHLNLRNKYQILLQGQTNSTTDSTKSIEMLKDGSTF